MGINLKKHNEKAYQKIKDMLKETDRAAVVHPTGTGKTYIALKWIEETSGKTIYVAPSNHILNQVKEDVEKAKESGEIIKTVEEIDIPTSLRNIRGIKEWMERNETTIPPRKSGENLSEEEKRLGKALSDIRCSLIKPYKELKTEGEREEYISKLENRAREPLSRKQFMEIIETIEEIDGDREKLTDLVEQSKATQEKVAEAKKLESMYEQELKSKEQKEGFDIQDSDN